MYQSRLYLLGFFKYNLVIARQDLLNKFIEISKRESIKALIRAIAMENATVFPSDPGTVTNDYIMYLTQNLPLMI